MRLGIIAFTFLLLIAVCSQVVGQNTTMSEGVGKIGFPVSEDINANDIAFTEENFRYTKNESIYFQAWFDDGWTLSILTFGFDHSLFNRWGIYVNLTGPNGYSFRSTLEVKPEDVSFMTNRLWIKIGGSTIEKQDDRYVVKVAIDDFAADLTFVNILSIGNPGDDTVFLSKDNEVFQRRVIICPLADVHGEISVNGQRRELIGRGYADRAIVVNSLNRLNPDFISLHLYSNENIDVANQWHMQVLDIRAQKVYGSKKMARLIVSKGGAYLMQTEDFQIELQNFSTFQHRGQSYPQRVYVSAESSGYALEGYYLVDQLNEATNILEEVPRWLQFIVALFLDVRLSFRCTGEFIGTVTMPDGSVEALHLTGPYVYTKMK